MGLKDNRWNTEEITKLVNSAPSPNQKPKQLQPKDLWYVHGLAYDLSAFVDRHPGGRDAIMMGKGMDCTQLFESYHLFRMPPAQLLEKYLVPNAPPCPDEAVKDFTFEEDGFYYDVKNRVRAYFQENKVSPNGGAFWQLAAVGQLVVISVLTYMSFVWGSVPCALLMGLLKGVTAVGAGHGMSHLAVFKGQMNYIFFRVFSFLILSNAFIWGTSHIVSHHVHTLVENDLQDNYPLKRVQKVHPHMWFHRWQHYYIWVVYAFGLPLWTMQDFIWTIPTLFTGRHKMRYLPVPLRIENTVVLGMNLVFTVFGPFFFLPFWQALAVFCAFTWVSSAVVVLQIVVNHEVIYTQHDTGDRLKKPGEKKPVVDWGVHQVMTSHNYGVDSPLSLHMSGGLNMQLEHHLFPGVHYIYYPALSKIVQQACKDYGLPYYASKNLFQALKAHYQLLKLYSKP